MKTYSIGNKKYTQSPLVIKQISNLLSELQGIVFTNFSPKGLFTAIGDKLPRLLACVLVPEGQNPKDVDREQLAEELELLPLYPDALEAVSYFLETTPPTLVLDLLGQIAGKAGISFVRIPAANDPTIGGGQSAPSSAAGTRSKGKKSAGK